MMHDYDPATVRHVQRHSNSTTEKNSTRPMKFFRCETGLIIIIKIVIIIEVVVVVVMVVVVIVAAPSWQMIEHAKMDIRS